jgi:hypothetical protein
MAPGKRALAIGYGSLSDIELQGVGEHIVSGNFPFALSASRGQIIERFPNNDIEREVHAPGPCFSASLKLPAGMSGSPIYDDEGVYVHGVVSIGSTIIAGVEAFGYGSMIGPLLGLPIERLNGQTLSELQEESDHGMPKLQGPGM